MARCRKEKSLCPFCKRQRLVLSSAVPLLLASHRPAPQCASNNARLLVTEACRPALLRCAHTRSARKLGEDLPTGFGHCLASTGSSLQPSTRVLVLVIAEYFTVTQYTLLAAQSQADRPCQCFICAKRENKVFHLPFKKHAPANNASGQQLQSRKTATQRTSPFYR